MNLKETLKEIEDKVIVSISEELSNAGVQAEVQLNPAMKGCIATLSTGEQLFIPISVRMKKNGSYEVDYQIPELTFLPKWEVFHGSKKYIVRASDSYHASLLVLKAEGESFPEIKSKKLAKTASLVPEETDDIVVVEEPGEFKREYSLGRLLASSLSKDGQELRESILGLEDSQVIMRILQKEFDQADVPVVVSSTELDGDEGVYHVESMSSNIKYSASLPVKVIERKNGVVYKVSCLIRPVKSVFGTKVFEVRLPNGNEVTVETTSKDKAMAAVEEYWVGKAGARISGKPNFEVISEKEVASNDFNEDVLLNPWATILDEENKYLVE